MADSTDNFLAFESTLIERLRTQVPELQQVAGYNDLDRDIFVGVRKSPAAFVVFDGVDRPTDTAGRGVANLLEKNWAIVLAVRGGNDKEATRRSLGTLITSTMRALDRFKEPGSRAQPLRLLAGPHPQYYAGGHATAILVYGQREIAPVALG